MTGRYMNSAMVLLMVVSLFGLVGCPGFWRTLSDALVPVEEENKLGEEFQEELEEELEFSDDDVLVEYIEDLGREVSDIAEEMGEMPDGIETSFHLVDDDEMVNAFAIPGGGIYVFTGLLKAMDDEAELMGVMGHEVAHVTERHIARRLTAAYGTEMVSAMALGEEPGLVGQLVTAVVQQGFMMSYSRSQEREADETGVRFQIAADYDPQGLISFFETLSEQPSPPTFLSTHPNPEERMENIREQISDISDVPDRRERERFQQMRDRIDAEPDDADEQEDDRRRDRRRDADEDDEPEQQDEVEQDDDDDDDDDRRRRR